MIRTDIDPSQSNTTWDKIITQRESEILNLISLGFTTSDIASSLSISKETVKTHRKHLLRKMNAKNVAVLVRRAVENGLILAYSGNSNHLQIGIM